MKTALFILATLGLSANAAASQASNDWELYVNEAQCGGRANYISLALEQQSDFGDKFHRHIDQAKAHIDSHWSKQGKQFDGLVTERLVSMEAGRYWGSIQGLEREFGKEQTLGYVIKEYNEKCIK